jgi:hypothetical protein
MIFFVKPTETTRQPLICLNNTEILAGMAISLSPSPQMGADRKLSTFVKFGPYAPRYSGPGRDL